MSSERKSTRKRKTIQTPTSTKKKPWNKEEMTEIYESWQSERDLKKIKLSGREPEEIEEYFASHRNAFDMNYDEYMESMTSPKPKSNRKLFTTRSRKQKIHFSFPTDYLKNESHKTLPPKLRSKKSTVVPPKQISIETNFDAPQEQKDKVTELTLELSKFISLKSKNFIKYEWFYSDVEIGFFKSEFQSCLEELQLGHLDKLTRFEWSEVRASMGKPRRFSPAFIKEEREKLAAHLEDSRRNSLNTSCDYYVSLPNRHIVLGKIIKCLPNHQYLIKFHDPDQADTIVRDDCLMSCTRLKLSIDLISLAHFQLKLKKKQEILQQIRELNDLYESHIREKDFEVRYAWLIVQLKEINTSIDKLKMKKVNEIPKVQILQDLNKEKALKMCEKFKLNDGLSMNSVFLLYQLATCLETDNLKPNEVDLMLNDALQMIRPRHGSNEVYQEIKELIGVAKRLFN